MTFSHASCVHPATSRDRAICRKAAASNPTVSMPVRERRARGRRDDRPEVKAADRAERQAVSRARRNAGRTASEARAEADAEAIVRKAKADAYRRAEAQARHPRGERGECADCGRPAGWTRGRKGPVGDPVCMQHVDYDDCRIIAL